MPRTKASLEASFSFRDLSDHTPDLTDDPSALTRSSRTLESPPNELGSHTRSSSLAVSPLAMSVLVKARLRPVCAAPLEDTLGLHKSNPASTHLQNSTPHFLPKEEGEAGMDVFDAALALDAQQRLERQIFVNLSRGPPNPLDGRNNARERATYFRFHDSRRVNRREAGDNHTTAVTPLPLADLVLSVPTGELGSAAMSSRRAG